jgi:hypothetical protein
MMRGRIAPTIAPKRGCPTIFPLGYAAGEVSIEQQNKEPQRVTIEERRQTADDRINHFDISA